MSKTFQKVDDKNEHIDPTFHKAYPEPEVPVDEAWKQMKSMLELNQAMPHDNAAVKTLWQKIVIFAAISAAIVVIVYFALHRTQPHVEQPAAKVYTTQNMPQKNILSNGTMVYADSKSSITEEIRNSNKQPVILSGAAYFDGTPQHPLNESIAAGAVTVIPQNAAVYIRYDTTTGIISVYLQSGAASLVVDGKKINLEAGKSIQYNERTKYWSDIEKANINLFGYATKVFDFNDTPLQEATAYIEKAYGVTIQFTNTGLIKCRITTRFDNKSLSEVLDIMAYTLNFEYTIKEHEKLVLISGAKCE